MGDEVQTDIPNVYDSFQQALVADQGWAWSWFCNIAVPLMDQAGLSHRAANEAAAHLFKHLFKIDVTGWKEYTDIIDGTTAAVDVVETEPAKPTADENSIYVTVTGFKENSGAEFIARALTELLSNNGYRVDLNLAATSLEKDQISTTDPKPGTHFAVTGVESRWHTDRHGAVEDAAVETAPEIHDVYTGDDIPDGDYNDADPLDFDDAERPDAEGDDTDPGDDDDGTAVASDEDCRPWREGKTKIDLVLSNCDTDPISTLQYVEDQFPKADINARVELDHFVTDAIHRERRARSKTVVLTLDPKDPNPEATIAALQQYLLDIGKNPIDHLIKEGFNWKADVTRDPEGGIILTTEESGLAMAEPRKRSLRNAEDLAGAHLIESVSGSRSIQFIDVNDPAFFSDVYPTASWSVVVPTDYFSFHTEIASLIARDQDNGADVDEVARAVYANNVIFQQNDVKKEIVGVKDELDFMELPQSAVPPTLFNELEKAWSSFNTVENCAYLETILAHPTDTFSIAIPYTEYRVLNGPGGMVYRKHPQHELLFVRLIRHLAKVHLDIAAWAKSVGIM